MRRGPRIHRPTRKAVAKEEMRLTATGLSHDGRGIARDKGQAVFVHGLLPGEQGQVRIERRTRQYAEGRLIAVEQPSPERVQPRCPHFGHCGGCQLQHLEPEAQISHKQVVALRQLERIGGIRPGEILAPLTGPHWGYRRRTRLGIQTSRKGVAVGFRARASNALVEVTSCPVLEPHAEALLNAVRPVLKALANPGVLGHLEIALGDEDAALLLRLTGPLAEEDAATLHTFAEQQEVDLYLQPAGSDKATCATGNGAPGLHYALEAFGLTLRWLPTDFTQVNAAVNRVMVSRAISLLDPAADERALDLFCGLGNFTLPLARHAAEVTGVEVSAEMVARGAANVADNGLGNCRFHAADLEQDIRTQDWFGEGFDLILLDPPRAGARTVVEKIPLEGVRALLYVSCDPATFARDAGILASRGMKLARWGVMDMFPQTFHVESMGLFLPA